MKIARRRHIQHVPMIISKMLFLDWSRNAPMTLKSALKRRGCIDFFVLFLLAEKERQISEQKHLLIATSSMIFFCFSIYFFENYYMKIVQKSCTNILQFLSAEMWRFFWWDSDHDCPLSSPHVISVQYSNIIFMCTYVDTEHVWEY